MLPTLVICWACISRFFQTFKPPVSEYQVVREKASAQKRDVERALTRFIAKTGDTENLFPDDPYAFPCKFTIETMC